MLDMLNRIHRRCASIVCASVAVTGRGLHRRGTGVWALSMVIALAGWGAGIAPAADTPSAGEAALARYLADRSELSAGMPREQMTRPQLRQAAALLEAASRLDPTEPRYPRLLAEVYLHPDLYDLPAAIDALKAYRALEPNDRVAQAQLIDLYVMRIETADGKVAYLRQLAGMDRLHPTVRSHVLTMLARAHLARSETGPADEALRQALELNPLNLGALRLRWDRLGEDAPAEQRVAVLVQTLRANPAELSALATLAHELSDAGLHQEAIRWYGLAYNVANATKQPLSPNFLRRCAAALYMAGQEQQAAELSGRLVGADAGDVDALLVWVLAMKRSDEPNGAASARQMARVALHNRLAVARQAIGVESATTRPIDSPPAELPNLAGDVELLQRADVARDAYVSAAVDVAWFELYFNRDARAAERPIAVLRNVLPEGSVTVARLEGVGVSGCGKIG